MWGGGHSPSRRRGYGTLLEVTQGSTPSTQVTQGRGAQGHPRRAHPGSTRRGGWVGQGAYELVKQPLLNGGLQIHPAMGGRLTLILIQHSLLPRAEPRQVALQTLQVRRTKVHAGYHIIAVRRTVSEGSGVRVKNWGKSSLKFFFFPGPHNPPFASIPPLGVLPHSSPNSSHRQTSSHPVESQGSALHPLRLLHALDTHSPLVP